jgi:acyl-CoA synthetase (AMP-forming)/AMP-acid ligase II
VVWRQEDILFATLGGGNPGGPPIERAEEIGARALVNRSHRIGPFLPPGDPGPEEFVALSLGPLIHASGQWTALSTLLGGGKLVLYTHRSMDMTRVLELVETERVTMLTIVGDTSGRPLVELLEERPGAYETSSLRLLGSGGSILTAAVKDRLLSALPSVLAISEAVGSSEAPVQATAVATKDGPLVSLSFSARDVTMVVDDELRPVTPGSGEVGRLATTGRGPIGYHKDPARTARTFVEIDGARWSLPGDMATVEADGTIRLLGRGSMCINTGGEKVYPEEVEAVIKAHPCVADAVVLGSDDPRWGQRVVCVVQPSSACAPTLEELQAHCRAQLAGYKAPRSLYLVDEVRRSPAGKPDYRWAGALVSEVTPSTS